MNLQIATGIDKLSFGMTKEEIITLIGNPDKTYMIDGDESETICDWNQLQMRLTFYNNQQGKLGYIRTRNRNVTFNDCPLIGQPIAQVIKNTFAPTDTWEIEEYDFFNTYFEESKWITFVADFGLIEEIELGVPFKNEFEYAWPNV